VSLVVEAPPDQFLTALRAQTGSMFLPALSSKSIIGRVSPDGSILVSPNTPMINNGWRSFLDARVAPYNAGSLVQGRYRLSRFVVVFSMIWLLFALGFFVRDLSHLRVDLFGFVFLATFLTIVSVGRLLALAGEKRLVADLARIGTASTDPRRAT
jgi:hypothetical protein